MWEKEIISLETFCLPNKLVLFYKNQEAICTHKCTIPGALSSYWHRNFENNSIQINGISKLSDQQLDQMSLAFFTYTTITKYELVCPKDIILIVHINERQRHNKMSFCHLSLCQFSSVQSLSHVRLFVTPWTVARQASLSITNPRSLLKLMSIESVMP